MIKCSIPVLRAERSAVAVEFYRGQLGSELRFAYRIDENNADPCYMGFCRDEVWLHVSSFLGDGVAGSSAYVVVDDVDALHAELVGRSVAIDLEPTDQTWGNREMYVRDSNGNSIRFIQERGD